MRYLFANPNQQDVQDLILWIVGEGVAPKWAFVRNKPMIPKVVVVFLDAITASCFAKFSSEMPFLSSLKPCTKIQAPGYKKKIYSPIAALLNVPVKFNENVKRRKIETSGSTKHFFFQSQKRFNHLLTFFGFFIFFKIIFVLTDRYFQILFFFFLDREYSISDYILSQSELEDNEYPLKAPEKEKDNWIKLPDVIDLNRPSLVALDCEMVGLFFQFFFSKFGFGLIGGTAVLNNSCNTVFDKRWI